MMASSTTSPIASTSASKVSRLMEKPNISIIVKVPIIDSGMAMIGISTDRGEPRNANTTRVTINTASTSVVTTSRIELFTNAVESYTIVPVMPCGNCAWMLGKTSRTPLMTSSRLAAGATWMPKYTARLPSKLTCES